MSANANQEILDRLSSLERANDNLVRDGLQRQREYGDLQRDIFQCHRDNSHLKEMMQSRLVDLERKTEEIELLKTRNGQLERENQQTIDRLVAMEEVVTSMGSDLAQVAEARDNIHDRLTQLEDTHVKESNDRVNAVQSAVNSLRQDMTTLSETVDTWKLRQKSTKGAFDDRFQILKAESEELHQSLSTSLDTTQRQVDARLESLENGSQQIRQAVTEQLDDVQNQVDSRINRSEKQMEDKMSTVVAEILQKIDTSQTHLSDSCHMLENNVKKVTIEIKEGLERDLNCLRQEVEGKFETANNETIVLGKQVVEINNMNNDVRMSVSLAQLEPTGGLVVGEWVKVDMCRWLKGSPGMVDKATGCLVPKRKGRYVVGLRMAQIGDGEIWVRLKWDGDIGAAMVQTVRDWDVKSGLHVMEMEEGEKYCLEAWRVEGTAEIKWCRVYCWFLSPC